MSYSPQYLQAVYAVSFSFLIFLPNLTSGHGYMYTPRSRNWVAYEDGDDSWSGTGGIAREYCYHCLNSKEANEVCGSTSTNNYDEWTDMSGDPIPWNSQETYTEGDIITIGSFLSTNHKGHQDVFVCADENPTQECFEQHPLEFIEDLSRNAPKDPNYPYRGMYAPDVQDFVHKFRLPQGVTGERVMMQWRYVTANSCLPPGYLEYPFPESDWLGGDHSTCSYPLDPTGDRCTGCPEQFWNCAEITINPSNPTGPTQPVSPTSPTTSSPVQTPTNNPVAKPTSLPTISTVPTKAPTPPALCKNSCYNSSKPWDKLCKRQNCAGCPECNSQPIVPPVSSPTNAPNGQPTSNEYCCTFDNFHCGLDTTCNIGIDNCQVECGGSWISKSSPLMQCISKRGECTHNENDCCNDLSCVGDESYKQCI